MSLNPSVNSCLMLFPPLPTEWTYRRDHWWTAAATISPSQPMVNAALAPGGCTRPTIRWRPTTWETHMPSTTPGKRTREGSSVSQRRGGKNLKRSARISWLEFDGGAALDPCKAQMKRLRGGAHIRGGWLWGPRVCACTQRGNRRKCKGPQNLIYLIFKIY